MTSLQPAYPEPDAKRLGHGLAWSRAELSHLVDHYARLGPVALSALLPKRGVGAITRKANVLGLRHHAEHPKRPSDARTDERITALYSQGPIRAGQLAELALSTGRSRQWLRWRAIQLGVIRLTRGAKWTEEEDAILRDAEGMGARYMQKRLSAAGYRRTEPQIVDHCQFLRLSAGRDRTDVYSVGEVCRLLGTGDHHSIRRWIRTGELQAQAVRNAEDKNVITEWRITRKALRSFMIANPTLWWPGRCDRHWLVEILANKQGAW